MSCKPSLLILAILSLWTGLLVGTPYLFAFTKPFGAGTLSSTYVFIACGLLIGTLVCREALARTTATIHLTRLTLFVVVCTVFTSAFVSLEWINASMDPLLKDVGVAVAVPVLYRGPVYNVARTIGLDPRNLQSLSEPFEVLVSFMLALACGFAHGAFWHVLDTGGTGHRRASASHRRCLPQAAVAALFSLGVLRTYFQLPWFPHSDYPIPRNFYDPFTFDLVWDSVGPSACVPAIVAVIVTFALYCLAFADVTAATRSADPAQPAITLNPVTATGAYCAGETAFRIVSRIEPGLFTPSEWIVWTGAAVFLLAFIALAVIYRKTIVEGFRAIAHATGFEPTGQSVQAGSPQIDPADAPASVPPTLAALESALTEREVALLAERGITPGELSAVRAGALGITSAQAADLLGKRASTIREYRRRVCEKLGVADFDGALAWLRDTQPEPPAKAGPAQTSARVAAYSAIALVGLVMVSLLMPLGSAYTSWTGFWTSIYGIALGFVCAGALARLVTPASPAARRGLACLCALCLIASAALVCSLRLGSFAPDLSTAAARLAVVLGYAVFTGSGFAALHSLLGIVFTGTPSQNPLELNGRVPAALATAVFAMFGWCFEELWRAQAYASLLAGFIPLFVSAIACTRLILRAHRVARRMPRLPRTSRALFAFGVGMLAGNWAANVYGTAALSLDSPLLFGNIGFNVLANLALALVTAAVGVVLIRRGLRA